MLVAFSSERVMPAKVSSPDASGNDMVIGGVANGDELFSGLCHGGSPFYLACCSCGQCSEGRSLLARAKFLIANIDMSALCSVGNLIRHAIGLNQSYACLLAFVSAQSRGKFVKTLCQRAVQDKFLKRNGENLIGAGKRNGLIRE